MENNPQHDGDDGTSFFGHQGEIFLYPLKGNGKRSERKQTNRQIIGIEVVGSVCQTAFTALLSIMAQGCEGFYVAPSSGRCSSSGLEHMQHLPQTKLIQIPYCSQGEVRCSSNVLAFFILCFSLDTQNVEQLSSSIAAI